MSTRSRIALVAAAAFLTVVGLGPRAWAWWTDAASGTGTLSAYTVPAPTNIACALTNKEALQNYWHGMRITATVPAAPTGGPAYTYSIQMVRIATPNAVIWTHALTPSGGTVTYNFVDSDVTGDQPTQDQSSVDYYVRVVVALTASPSWTANAQINIDANNSSGILGIIGAGVYYGSPVGSTSPGGQPGRCAT